MFIYYTAIKHLMMVGIYINLKIFISPFH